MESGTILKWAMEEGASISAGDVIAEIQTDKATVDFEAQDDAVLAKILVAAGDGSQEVKVGDPICIFVDDEEHVSAFKNYQLGDGNPASAQGEAASAKVEAVATPAAPTPTPAPAPVAVAPLADASGRVKASPLAYKIAKELGISINTVSGTGPNGRILADDVREFVPPITPAVAESITSAAPVTVRNAPVSTSGAEGVFTDYATTLDQQQLAVALTAQKQSVPHYYLTVDLKLDAIMKLRSTHSELSVNALLLKAAICALKDCPVMNARWMEGFVRMYHEVALEYVLPNASVVIPNAASKGATEIDAAISEVSEGGSTSFVGTFSVVNLGMYGVKSAAPIIRPGQSGILGIGAAENRVIPSSKEGEEYATAVMATATLSCDHRVVDGAVGAQWLASFKGYVENPISMIM